LVANGSGRGGDPSCLCARDRQAIAAGAAVLGFGQIKGFRHATIKAKLPKYADLSVAEEDLRSGTIYSGPYEGYSDVELALVIDDLVVKPHWNQERTRAYSGEHLLTGKLIHFREMDEKHKLPPGTAKKQLAAVVTRNDPIRVAQETDNTIRFEEVDWEEYQEWLAERGYYYPDATLRQGTEQG
jgi:hypothetical protein